MWMLEELRKQIDAVDSKIIGLLGERFRVAEKIANKKKKEGIEIYDEKREKDVLERVMINAKNVNIPQESAVLIYREIIRQTRDFEKK